MIRQILYPSKFEPINAPANPVVPTQWFGPLSEPRKLVVAAAVLAASGCTLAPQPISAPVTTPAWGWHSALSQPIAAKKKFSSDFVLVPLPPVQAPNGWQAPFFEPSRAHRSQQIDWQYQPVPIIAPAVAPAWGWYNPFSVPTPAKRQFYSSATWAPQVVAADPVVLVLGWQAPLSEPVRVSRKARTDYTLPLAPPDLPPNGWQYQFGQTAKAASAKYQAVGLVTPAQPPIIIPPPDQWYSPLSVPLFQVQSIRTRNALVNSLVFSFPPPTEEAPIICDPANFVWADTPRQAVLADTPRQSILAGR
jgi:hypothetical protein